MTNPTSQPSPPNTGAPQRSSRPYVGPRTFEEREADRFFGRDREARDLLALVVRERLVLFYAQSGAGKSSLLNARLIPDLRSQGFEVLPVGRVSGVLPTTVDPNAIANIFVYNLILSLNQGLPEDQRLPPATLTATSLLAYLGGEELAQADAAPAAALSAEDDLAATVLVIDQFEELVTTNLEHWPAREGFFRQLGAVLERLPNLWVVLTLREDYVARLDPYAELLPNRQRARFYMERMGVAAAQEAVTRPAADYGHPFISGVAETLVDNLRRIRVHSEDEPHLGQYVEPVQLQVVCFQLWDKLNGPGGRWRTDPDPSSQQITEADLPLDYIDQALTRFYEDALHDVLADPKVQAAKVSERALRDWFSRQLITDAGIRNSLLRNEETRRTSGLPNVAVDRLARHYLVRTELRAGGAWVELVHDRFVEPILDANFDWIQRQSPLLRAAQEWQDNGRQAERLLLAPQLTVLAADIAAAPQDPLVAEFVAASAAAAKAEAARLAAIQREQELAQAQLLARSSQERLVVEAKRAEEQEQAARRLRRQLVVIVVIGFLAIVAAIVAGMAGYVANQLAIDARTAEARAKAALSVALVEKIGAQTAQADAYAMATAAAAAQQTSEAQRLEAEAARQSVFELANSLAIALTALAPTSTPTPTDTPTPASTPTPRAPDAPPATPTLAVIPVVLASATPELPVNYGATATVDAIQEQLSQAQATQTAVATALPPSQLADTRLAIGMSAQMGQGLNATVRTQPGSGAGEIVAYLSGGEQVLIVDGPILLPGDADTIVWWKVQLPDGSQGWTPANTSQFTLLSPVAAGPVQQLAPQTPLPELFATPVLQLPPDVLQNQFSVVTPSAPSQLLPLTPATAP